MSPALRDRRYVSRYVAAFKSSHPRVWDVASGRGVGVRSLEARDLEPGGTREDDLQRVLVAGDTGLKGLEGRLG
jgi:hypothetical protein